MFIKERTPILILLLIVLLGTGSIVYIFSSQNLSHHPSVAEVAQASQPFVPTGFSQTKHAEKLILGDQVFYISQLQKDTATITISISQQQQSTCPGQEEQRGLRKLCFYARSGIKYVQFTADTITYEVSSKDLGFTELERITESL